MRPTILTLGLLSLCSACTAPLDDGAPSVDDRAQAVAAEDLDHVSTGESDAVVRDWNAQVIATARARSLSDAHVARTSAMVNVAIYDAVNGIARLRGHALVAPTSAAGGSRVAAAARAAHDVLASLFPDQLATYDTLLASQLAGVKPSGAAASGAAWGAVVAAEVLARRAADGATPAETQPAGTGPGQFRAAFANAQFRNLAPFAIASATPYISSGPPALTSVDYAAAYAEVQILGSAAIVDPAKLETFTFWSLGSGTSQPPGAWIQIALEVTATHPQDLANSARLFALLGMAMSDSVAPTFASKFLSHAWRPTTAIREGDTDGNAATVADPAWAARAGSVGGTPEYWSGHSSFSAAAATVLAGFFCDDGIAFDFTSESAPADARHYDSFSAAMTEAGRSRVFGGQHFEFSNQAGLTAGRGVGREVISKMLLRKHGPVRVGSCPL